MQHYITRGRIIAVSIFLLIIAALFVVASYSYVEVSLPSTATKNRVITLTNQDSNKSTDITPNATQVKRLVRSGNYVVKVQDGESSYQAFVHAAGFLRSAKVVAKLEAEHARTFVGTNPKSCIYDLGDVVASDPCQGMVDDLQIHVPATNVLPSFAKKIAGPAGILEGLVGSADKNTAVIRSERDGEGNGSYHLAYSVGSRGAFTTSAAQELSDLDGSASYSIQPFELGFIAYTTSPNNVFVYPSAKEKPKKLTLPIPNNKALTFRSLATSGKAIIVVFSNSDGNASELNNPEGDVAHSKAYEKQATKGARSEIFVLQGNQSKQLSVDDSVVSVTPCGNQKLCVLTGGARVIVYQERGEDYDRLYELTGVRGMNPSGDRLLVVLSDGVLSLNTSSRDGFLVYSFGSYRYCGLGVGGDRIILCITDVRDHRFALSLSSNDKNIDSIDKKLAKLGEEPEIDSFSVFGRYIHVSPALGEITYQPSLGGFGHDPVAARATAARIDNRALELGIDPTKYTIVNPYR